MQRNHTKHRINPDLVRLFQLLKLLGRKPEIQNFSGEHLLRSYELTLRKLVKLHKHLDTLIPLLTHSDIQSISTFLDKIILELGNQQRWGKQTKTLLEISDKFDLAMKSFISSDKAQLSSSHFTTFGLSSRTSTVVSVTSPVMELPAPVLSPRKLSSG